MTSRRATALSPSARPSAVSRCTTEFCSSCHQVDFYETKLAAWQDASVGELFSAMSATMPSANPGGLTSAQYLDVLAYIFSITGSPAGNEELSLGNMDAVADCLARRPGRCDAS